MSPARMYSRICATAASYPSGVKDDRSSIAVSAQRDGTGNEGAAALGFRASTKTDGAGEAPRSSHCRTAAARDLARWTRAFESVSGIPVEITHALDRR